MRLVELKILDPRMGPNKKLTLSHIGKHKEKKRER